MLLCMLAYSFMFFQFWWGDHDWGYIKDGVSLESGFFEARYTQHLFTVLLLDGHVLPIFSFIISLISLVVLNMMIAYYLEVPKTKFNYILFVLFFSLNPHVYAFFYYVYLAFPFIAWCIVGVGILFLFEKQSLIRFLIGVVLFVLLLGSYPPNITLFFVLFVAKRIIAFLDNRESILDIIKKGCLFALEVVLGYIGFKCIFIFLQKNDLINLDMYNISTKGIYEILQTVPFEMWYSIAQWFEPYSFMDGNYCVCLIIPIVLAMFLMFRSGKNKLFMILFWAFILFLSRFVFLIATKGEVSAFRLVYFGKIGVLAFALSIIMQNKEKCIKNILMLWGCVCLSLFVETNFYIHKVQYFGFVAGRKYQHKLLDKLVMNKNFKYEKKYISLTFGYPNFRNKFYNGTKNSGEMNGQTMVFYFDTINQLFWEEKFAPVAVGAGILNSASILRVNRDGGKYWGDDKYWTNNPENMKNIREWLYMKAKLGSVYIDDKYILAILDENDFYKNRELVATSLDK